MATIITKCLILIILSFAMSPQILVNGHQQVPCLFLFGDSNFDNGNNNALNTRLKANYRPYGIDYPGAVPTGRFTNGLNIADFLAKLLGFSDSIPPFVTTRGSAILKGLNYASGAAGILETTGIEQGQRFTLNKQLVNHYATIGQFPRLLGNRSAANKYVRQCLYVVNIGLNDYVNNYYLQSPSPSPSRLLTPDAFADLLIRTFSQQLRTLYNLGSRKVAVFGLELIGCIPQVLSFYPTTNGSLCVDSINNEVQIFNNKLVSLIKHLNTNLPNARFTYINVTSISLGDPSLAGVKVVNAACCEVGSGKCVENGAVCSNRDEYLFFDNFIQTQISMKATASRAYKALLPADVFPVDIQRLVQQ